MEERIWETIGVITRPRGGKARNCDQDTITFMCDNFIIISIILYNYKKKPFYNDVYSADVA